MKNKVKLKSISKLSVAADMFKIEKKLLSEGWDFIVGVDEAGRGPLAGPVVVGAIILEEKNWNDEEKKLWNLIRDSKNLSEKRREEVFEFLTQNFRFGVGICNHETIDRVNVLEATFLAMKKAIGELKSQVGSKDKKMLILVDGDKIIPNFSCAQKSIISGDKLVKSISAASIIAKVTRDRMMNEFDERYPVYQFVKHKGYGTKIHIDALKQNGPCEIHRKTFSPVRNAINDRWKV